MRDEIIGLRRALKSNAAARDVLDVQITERKKEVDSKFKVSQLLPDGSENLDRLKGIIRKIETKMATLKEAFEEMKKEKDEEYQVLLKKKEEHRVRI